MLGSLEENHIFDELAQSLYDSAAGPHQGLRCEYEVLKDFGTISSSWRRKVNDEWIYFEGPVGFASRNAELCEKLLAIMGQREGGEWTSMTLTLDADGRASAKFHYPDAGGDPTPGADLPDPLD